MGVVYGEHGGAQQQVFAHLRHVLKSGRCVGAGRVPCRVQAGVWGSLAAGEHLEPLWNGKGCVYGRDTPDSPLGGRGQRSPQPWRHMWRGRTRTRGPHLSKVCGKGQEKHQIHGGVFARISHTCGWICPECAHMAKGPEDLSGCKGTSGRASARVLCLEVEKIEQMQCGLRRQEGEWMNLGTSHNLLSSVENRLSCAWAHLGHLAPVSFTPTDPQLCSLIEPFHSQAGTALGVPRTVFPMPRGSAPQLCPCPGIP